jgi:hypothetical protein
MISDCPLVYCLLKRHLCDAKASFEAIPASIDPAMPWDMPKRGEL